ncbi:MAG: ArsC/Spx/MgsR family protein [Pseudomonadota bacterium]
MELYGLKACDTCRKALKELTAAGRKVQLNDVRENPVPPETLAEWYEVLGEALVNRRSTTWKGLSEDARSGAGTSRGAVALLAAHPALMKRPVTVADGTVHLGWTSSVKAALGL